MPKYQMKECKDAMKRCLRHSVVVFQDIASSITRYTKDGLHDIQADIHSLRVLLYKKQVGNRAADIPSRSFVTMAREVRIADR